MAKRATLQKQSFSAPCLIAQRYRAGGSCGGLILCQQTGNSARMQSREPNQGDDGHSYFQDGFTLALQSPSGCGAEPGGTFCTATSLSCQEIRYPILSGILQSFPRQGRSESRQIARKNQQFPDEVDKALGSQLWKLFSGKQVVKRGIHGQSATSMGLRSYLIQEGTGIEQNLAYGNDISWHGGERRSSEHPQMGTLRRLLGRSGWRGRPRGKTTAD